MAPGCQNKYEFFYVLCILYHEVHVLENTLIVETGMVWVTSIKFTDDVVCNKINIKANKVLGIQADYETAVFPLHFVSSEWATTRDFSLGIQHSSSTLFC